MQNRERHLGAHPTCFGVGSSLSDLREATKRACAAPTSSAMASEIITLLGLCPKLPPLLNPAESLYGAPAEASQLRCSRFKVQRGRDLLGWRRRGGGRVRRSSGRGNNAGQVEKGGLTDTLPQDAFRSELKGPCPQRTECSGAAWKEAEFGGPHLQPAFPHGTWSLRAFLGFSAKN